MEVIQGEIQGGGSLEACEGGRGGGRWISGSRVHAVSCERRWISGSRVHAVSCEIQSDRGGEKREAVYNSIYDRVCAQSAANVALVSIPLTAIIQHSAQYLLCNNDN